MYRKEDGGSGTAVWLAESNEETAKSLGGIGSSSNSHQTIEVQRERHLEACAQRLYGCEFSQIPPVQR